MLQERGRSGYTTDCTEIEKEFSMETSNQITLMIRSHCLSLLI